MRDTLQKKSNKMATLSETHQTKEFQASHSPPHLGSMAMSCKSLFAEGFTNKSRMKNVQVGFRFVIPA